MKVAVEQHDPFSGRVDKVKESISDVLQRPFSGSLSEAMHLGNSLMLAFRILDGTYDISETQFNVRTIDAE